jgi:hypothetical protein
MSLLSLNLGAATSYQCLYSDFFYLLYLCRGKGRPITSLDVSIAPTIRNPALEAGAWLTPRFGSFNTESMGRDSIYGPP